MKVPLSWLKDFVDIDLSPEELARKLTMAGLEVEEIQLVGLHTQPSEHLDFKITGLSWDADKIVVAQINEVMPHPNADRLTLCRLYDGDKEHVVLTGAPNLFPYKGQGLLAQPLKVAYAREGARIYDGHQPGQVLTTLKRAKIRGVESYSMVCSEKELGISEEHEGVIILDSDAPTGVPLADYIGDAVFEVSILPNMIRNACMVGVAREVSALTGKRLRLPPQQFAFDGPPVAGKASIQIFDAELNPRFVLGLIRDVEIKPSPYKIQLRLRLAGMRPINAIVDATNYVMLEVGEPLHAFDYDVLVQRAGGIPPTMITRTAQAGERLTTLDGADRELNSFTELVCDTAGALSLAGVMGGSESEVSSSTRNILLEGASWNFINIRRTVAAQKLQSEAAYRFSRGVHPELAPWGVQLGLERMRLWAGGQVLQGVVDAYPRPVVDPQVTITTADVERRLGIALSAQEITGLLESLEFKCQVDGDSICAQTPPHRLDIGEGWIGLADLMEEIARIYGYDRIPSRRLQDALPPQRGNPQLEKEEHLRDILVNLGLQEVITFRLTHPDREARLAPTGSTVEEMAYVRLQNPIAPERSAMRRRLLASLMEIMEHNSRLSQHLALFEIGPVFLPREGQILPDEPVCLAIALTGQRQLPTWTKAPAEMMDFFDLKGILEATLDELHVSEVVYEPFSSPSYHPGKCARIRVGQTIIGHFGELHPLVKEHYDFGEAPLVAAELDLNAFLPLIPPLHTTQAVPVFPPVLEDIAVIVDEALPAAQVEAAIRQAGGKLLSNVRLFDIFRGEQIGLGKKSLAYSLTYQAQDRTLNDSDAAQVRQRVIRRLEQELGARLRS